MSAGQLWKESSCYSRLINCGVNGQSLRRQSKPLMWGPKADAEWSESRRLLYLKSNKKNGEENVTALGVLELYSQKEKAGVWVPED